jgi:hypothetical protein
MAKCEVCNKEFESDRQLHGHLKAHGMRMAEYYQKYFPRYDLHDNKIIKFKNKNQYLSSNFNNRKNLKLWLDSVPEDEAKGYCIDFLSTRIKEKNIIYSPSQVELRSLMSPPVQYYDELLEGYYKICERMNLQNKYKKFDEIISNNEYTKPEYKILVDTREQKPLRFKRGVEVRKLDFGDYAFSSPIASCNCYIERKSLADFIGTLSGGYERFVKEIQRAEQADSYLVILIESKFTNALYFNTQRKSYNKERVFKNVKATPEFIFHRVRNLIQKYPNIQFLFTNGRKEASRVMEKIFTCGCAYADVDLQLAYDLKKL